MKFIYRNGHTKNRLYMTFSKYDRRTVASGHDPTVLAIQYTGENYDDILPALPGSAMSYTRSFDKIIEGPFTVNIGDWVIRRRGMFHRVLTDEKFVRDYKPKQEIYYDTSSNWRIWIDGGLCICIP